ncbi:hypothetical protein BJF78_34755 [Pseudonocardia sp. CNS-139]|nr:hypothetical protein BJF78_34755 [Pseudonocardia sp. CNS-139]
MRGPARRDPADAPAPAAMMSPDPLVELAGRTAWAPPGGESRVRVTVHNPGDRDEQYRLDVLGDAARWAQLEPRLLAVPAGESGVTDVVLRPPHGTTAPPGTALGVRCVRVGGAEQGVVAEADLLVSPVADLDARIEPAVGSGARRSRHVVTLHRHGSAPAPVVIETGDPRQALGFAVAPREVTVEPGGTERVYVTARTRRPVLLGARRTHPFTVGYRVRGAPGQGELAARFEQRPVLGVAGVLGIVLVALGLVAGLMFWAFRYPLPAAPPTSAAPATAASGDPVQGHFVIYGPPTPIDDVANLGAAERLLSALQAGGVDARLVDSRDSDQLADGLSGLWVVLRDGFPTAEAAHAECTAHRDLAPYCYAVAPR